MSEKKNPLIVPLKGAGATLIGVFFIAIGVSQSDHSCLGPALLYTLLCGVLTFFAFKHALRGGFPKFWEF